MEIALRTVEDVEDSLEGAVISCLVADDDGGLRIILADGRSILIPDAVIVAILPAQSSREIH